MAKPKRRRIPMVEWVAGLGSLAIVLGTLGYLAFESLQGPPGDPALTVKILQVREREGAYVVDVEIENGSRGAAADVHLSGAARSADGRETRPQARVDYVPGFSTRKANLIFAFDPGPDPDVRVTGYARP